MSAAPVSQPDLAKAFLSQGNQASETSAEDAAPANDGTHAMSAPLLSLVDADVEVPLDDSLDERYKRGRLLGRGGMGDVRVCKDRRVGRDVALKVLRAEGERSDEVQKRFVREARVQGQLEHPAVVPVYDLGIDAHGAVYFTMKRVRGLTLAAIVRGLADGNAELAARYSRRKLLTAFSSVCMAVHYAHTRGVLHRDLKPANIMLGDFGEVHVLDWGLARVWTVPDVPVRGRELDVDAMATTDSGPNTTAGAMLGTPSYASPEQLRGVTDGLDARSDVYSLGVVLFELLTLRPLHKETSIQAVVLRSLEGVDARICSRFPHLEIPPELEAVCIKATALKPEDRYESAKALHDAIERYLDGERDQQMRQQLADKHLLRARELLQSATKGNLKDREEALRELMRSLTLHPSKPETLAVLGYLLTETGEQVPAEARAELDEREREVRAGTLRALAVRYGVWLLMQPLVLSLGVRHVPFAVCASGMIALMAAVGAWFSYQKKTGRGALGILLMLSTLGVGVLSSVFGPFVFVPGIIGANAVLFALCLERRDRVAMLVVSALAMLGPLALELVGIVPPSLSFHEGMLRLHPRIVNFPPVATLLVLIAVNLSLMVLTPLLVGTLRDKLRAAEQRLFLQAWQLRQLIPAEARDTLRELKEQTR